MKILITGANGFIGQNLCAALEEIRLGHDRRPDHAIEDIEILRCVRGTGDKELADFCKKSDFVVHLAGVNRPKEVSEYMEGNCGLAEKLLDALRAQNNECPVLFASSLQAELTGRFAGSEYGKSKRAGEELFFEYGKQTGAKVLVYRFPNVFGKWSRPNYNSAVATFCHNIGRGLPIRVNDRETDMELVYIDDVVEEIIRAIRGEETRGEDGFCLVKEVYRCKLGYIADTIMSFAGMNDMLEVPDLADPLVSKLYATYLSFLPEEAFGYGLKTNEDSRGSFTEIIRTLSSGQFSVNVSRPGETKGNHWHHTKSEKFVVVKGEAVIRLRRIGTDADGRPFPTSEFRVSGSKPEVIQMIPGYTHSITNLSDTEDLVTFMWASEPFDPARPDTFYQEV